MSQVFYLDVVHVAVATYICCKRLLKMFHLFQVYVANVFTCFICMLQKCFILQHYQAQAVPTGVAVPTCAASEAGVGGPHLHAHQQAWGVQLHVYVHQHVGADVQTHQLRAACGAGVQAQQSHAGQQLYAGRA